MAPREGRARRPGRLGLFSRRPSPTVPDGITTGDQLGQYGGSASAYIKALRDQSAVLMPGRSITRRPEVVRKMRRHYQISACLAVVMLSETGAHWSIECDDDDVREWLTSAYRLVSSQVQRSSARAIWAGYSPNTLTWDYDPNLGGLVITEIRDLAPETCEATVDAAGSYTGFVQNQALGGGAEPFDLLSTLWITEAQESGYLYGRSVLEAAYDPFVDHAAIRLFHGRYLERFGEPVVKMRAPSGMTISNQREIETASIRQERAVADGASQADAAALYPIPDPVLVDNVAEAQSLGEELRHHSVISFPSTPDVGPDGKVIGYAWDAEYLEAKRSGGSDLLDALRECDRRMARGIFIPDTLFQGDANASTYALGASHRTVWTESVEDRLTVRAEQQTAQVVDRLRLINFGPSAPHARLVYSPEGEDQSDKLWTVVEQLITDGKLDPDGVAIASELGLPLAETQPVPAPPNDPTATQSRDRIVVRLAAGDPGDIAGLPPWKLPQAYDPPSSRRPLTAIERRVSFDRIERGLNDAEARTIEQITALLERERDRVDRQVRGAMRKGTPAEILTALGSIELRGTQDVSRAWSALMGDVWQQGLDEIRSELQASADRIPTSIGGAGNATIGAYSSTNAERILVQLTTDLRSELLNAYTSTVAPAAMSSLVSAIFDTYESGEGKGPRLITRMLSSKALNLSRRDAIERGGVPIQGAQYSALLDARVCDLCAYLDGMVIPASHTDLSRFTPPQHFNCRCVWVWITADEPDFTPTWSSPSKPLVDRFGGLVFDAHRDTLHA